MTGATDEPGARCVPDLRDEIAAAARAAFTELRARHGDLCGYALYSDSDGGTVCVAVETAEHRRQVVADHPDWAEQLIWYPAEWAHEGVASQHFDAVHAELDAIAARGADLPDDESDLAFDQYRLDVWRTCVQALADLRADGTVPTDDQVTITFVVSDHEAGEETDWVRTLNTPAAARRYLVAHPTGTT